MLRGALIGLALLTGTASPAAAEPSAPESVKFSRELKAFQSREARLFAIGWRLARANARYCDDTEYSSGLLLQDVASYGEPALVRAALGLSGDFGVQAVAPASPAEEGGLAVNDTVLSVDGVELDEAPLDPKRPWARLADIEKDIAASHGQDGKITLKWRNPGGAEQTHSVAGIQVCSSRFELATRGKRALADGTRVRFGAAFPAFAYAEDELAAAIAHELAHNLLRHRAWLDTHGRKQSSVRLTEREADRLMPWLLANAGYDPQASLRFMERWGPDHSGGIFRKRTHEGWDERAEAIAAELEGMQQFIEPDGSADWRAHFTRETGPDTGS
ncbi:PDZ domain-containing protein [Altererythrobacter sp.]|uniref:PDZ domain-containing protein n=1 Tax=Altererythrobacter sp. TaxID=1872480 RepID=UPI003D0B4F5B